MHDGQIVEEGPPEAVLKHPQHRQTKALVAAIPRLRSA
jgi:ABC-type oligopeptide transport system ATPase subunit